MNLERLAAKQKRIREWSRQVQCGIGNEQLKLSIVDSLKDYRNLLAKCWEKGSLEHQEEKQVDEFERQLEQKFEEARLLADTPPRGI